MFQLLKISFKQIFSKSSTNNSKFIIYFSVVSLAVCLSALTLATSLSNGFKNKINLKLSSIDGHYRINAFYYYPNDTVLSSKSIAEIKNELNNDSLFSSYSAYTENYALGSIAGKSEGLLIYGIDSIEVSNIFTMAK